jgi:hypothetical protein
MGISIVFIDTPHFFAFAATAADGACLFRNGNILISSWN